jgi:SWI/SNF-related matrix-associated actin-dependent regulator of chromatin subfamily A3
MMEATCLYDKKNPPREMTTVRMVTRKECLELKCEESDEKLGIVVSAALSELAQEPSVTLSACLGHLKKRPPGGLVPNSVSSVFHVGSRTLRVVVYGLLSKKSKITAALDESGLFLQRPDRSEVDRRVRYFNPMYLVPPGKKMPWLANSWSIESEEYQTESADERFEEIQKSRILDIFEKASGPSSSKPLDLKQSSRIISTLKEYVRTRRFTVLGSCVRLLIDGAGIN